MKVSAGFYLILYSTGDTGGQYLNYINNYLTAQKIGTAIDVCLLGSDCGLLQQGADITGGYYRCVQEASLTQILALISNSVQHIVVPSSHILSTHKLLSLVSEGYDYSNT